MADNNKPMKYAKYAVGEIVLVVLGILIALFISERSQERANETKITNIFKEIQSDIIKNIETSYAIFDYQIYTDSVSKLILNNKYIDAVSFNRNKLILVIIKTPIRLFII